MGDGKRRLTSAMAWPLMRPFGFANTPFQRGSALGLTGGQRDPTPEFARAALFGETENVSMKDAFEAEGNGLAQLAAARPTVHAMVMDAEAAVLRPRNPGGLPHALRAALAARIADLHGKTAPVIVTGDDELERAAHADFDGGDDGRLRAILAFTDKVAMRPREADAADIDALRAAGVSEADIVRLAELNAFLAFRLRLAAGLSLL